MSTSITTRQTAGTGATVKGSPLSNTEVDNNFIGLNQAVQPAGGTAGQILAKIDATNFNSQWVDNYAVQVKLPVKNSTGATISKGAVVYISGATGANALISLAQASGDSTSATTVGFLESTLATGDTGLVVVTGVIAGIDTSAATEGDPVWLSGTTPGGVLFGTANKPQAPTHIVYLGTVTRAHATVGEIQVHISNGWELEELHDVKITSKANNDTLFYNSAQGVWVNAAPAAARSNLGLGALAVESSLKTVNGNSLLGSGNIQIDGGVTSFNTRTGAVTLSSGDVTTALGFTPYNSSNPNGYITSSALSSYLPLSGGTLSGAVTFGNSDTYFQGSTYLRSDSAFNFLTNSGSAQNGRFNGIQVSDSYSGAIPSNCILFGTDTQLRRSSMNTLTIGGNVIVHAGNVNSYAPSINGGSTIYGITYFGNSESMQVYGIRGRFSNEFIHLYNKVGIGNPNGWGVGESSTPDQGLSTYGSVNIAYGTGASSTFNGAALFNRNNPAITNGSYTVGNNHIELRTTDASNPAIGFHRSGYTAVTLYHNANNSLRLRDANTGADSMMVHSSNYYDAGIFGWRGQVPTNGWNDATTGMWVSYNQTNETGGPGGYTYGGLLSFRASDYGNNHRAQMYFSHTGEFKYRTGWNDWSYGWYTVLNSSNYTSYSPSLSGNYKNLSVGGLYSRYNYNESAYITDSTSAYTLSPDYGQTTVAMHNSHGAFSDWATTLTMSGYERYGAYQISGHYNASTPALAIRNYSQALGGWTSWTRLLSAGNYSSYALPLSGGTLSGALRTSENTGIFIGNGVTTSNALRINFHTDGDLSYYIGKRAGGWTQPMDIAFYTGLRYHAHNAYGGHRWYTTGVDSNLSFSVGDGDNNVRVTNTLYSYAYRGNGNVGGTGEASWHPAGIYSGGTNWLYGTIYTNGNGIYAGGAYSEVTAYRANRANGNFYIDDNYGCGIVGAYSSYRYQGVFAMGDSYKLPASGETTGSLYGMAWAHPNAGGVAGNLDSHGMIVMINGGFGSCMSYSIRASGNVTAYSDERLKTNWRPMPDNYVARLAQVKVGVYDRIDGDQITQVGVGAQSFQTLLPEAITTAKDEMGTLAVSYGNAALASAVELAKDNVELRARIERLESLIETLIGDQK